MISLSKQTHIQQYSGRVPCVLSRDLEPRSSILYTHISLSDRSTNLNQVIIPLYCVWMIFTCTYVRSQGHHSSRASPFSFSWAQHSTIVFVIVSISLLRRRQCPRVFSGDHTWWGTSSHLSLWTYRDKQEPSQLLSSHRRFVLLSIPRILLLFLFLQLAPDPVYRPSAAAASSTSFPSIREGRSCVCFENVCIVKLYFLTFFFWFGFLQHF